MLLVSETFPVPGDTLPGPSPWEHQLCQQLHSVASSIQVQPKYGWWQFQELAGSMWCHAWEAWVLWGCSDTLVLCP